MERSCAHLPPLSTTYRHYRNLAAAVSTVQSVKYVAVPITYVSTQLYAIAVMLGTLKWIRHLRRIAIRGLQVRRSRPVSRVLSRAIIPLGRSSPNASSGLPGSHAQTRAAGCPANFPIWPCSRWGLPCHAVLPRVRCALTAPFHPYRHACARLGGLLSVALSVGSRPPGVTWHLVRRSPDFPPHFVRNAAITRPTPGRTIRPGDCNHKSTAGGARRSASS